MDKQLIITSDKIEEKDRMVAELEGQISGVGIKIHGIIGIVNVYPA